MSDVHVLVTGATGTVGSAILAVMTSRGVPVRALARNPGMLPENPLVDVVKGDYDDQRSLDAATAGVEVVFLLTTPESPVPRHDRAILRAARSAGVSRIVKLSATSAGARGPNNRIVGTWHRAAEDAVTASGLSWTILRPSSFASNFLRWADAINQGHPIPNMTGSGLQGVIDPRDVAAVSAECLLSGVGAGQTITLTGPELLSVPDQVARLARVLGRQITTVDVPPDQARERMRSSGMAGPAIETVVAGATWAREGGNARITEEVRRILGRPPGTFESWALDHRAAFDTPPASPPSR
ncbi:NAD-dependent epimerase/dehydratase family protein [Nonomuraea deserti]|uniref:NAD-dependent epimerase/dehydratase family protein n=1 Tax=Nonomuraea deserti TaxID=1848322 RepID=A0A4R4VPN0_9ACTN|nr:NAD(P)H-binding protein [Nonomuraea deserti]TDD02060.1 NAD-dependent epimerase/dehydratase family protein [Nonomuraea deserti]